MNHLAHKYIINFVLLIMLAFFFGEITAKTTAGSYDYSHRKRECEITLVTPTGEPVPLTVIGIRLLRNDFVFGGTIRSDALDSIGDDYGEMFLSYFDVATPENEMKWEQTMKCPQKCDSDFSKADSLITWLQGKKIPVRGHSLFSNEKEDQIPEWTRNLGTTAFKQAMQEHINTAMEHFKGKVELWDLINEICHGENGSFLSSSLLETKSGDPNIISWVIEEARKKDSTAKFVIDDYAIITSNDQAATDQFVNKVKPLSSKFQIIGAEGHFGSSMNKNAYESKINYLAQQLGKPVWITDVDFSVDINQAPDKLEELMRTCFANPNVGGLTIGNWNERYLSSSNLTCYFIDSLNNKTPAGERWREVRNEWKTDTGGSTDEFGKFKFNGFQGEYMIHVACFIDTFYLEPGEGTKTIQVKHLDGAAVKYAPISQKAIEFVINGRSIPVRLPSLYNKQFFLTTYSMSGQLLSRSPINLNIGKCQVTSPSSCFRVFRIETAEQQPLYTGKVIPFR